MAVYLVLRKIDLNETLKVFTRLHPGWLLLGCIFFNLSKLISAFRLQHFLRSIGIFLTNKTSIKLCYVGMFYNLFLPGGIGGDGYKVYYLKKTHEDGSLKNIFLAALLDRINGVLALLFFAILFFKFTSLNDLMKDQWMNVMYVPALLLFYPVLFLIYKLILKRFLSTFFATNAMSLGVQLFQLVCSYFLLLSLGITTHHIDYLELFLISSVVAVLPITIGGIGVRELVFIYGFNFLPIEKNPAVAFSLLFFIVTAISSLLGSFVRMDEVKNKTR